MPSYHESSKWSHNATWCHLNTPAIFAFVTHKIVSSEKLLMGVGPPLNRWRPLAAIFDFWGSHRRKNAAKSSSTKSCFPQKVIFHGRSSSTEGCLPPKVVFHQKVSSTNGHLPTEGRLPMNVVFQQRSPPNEGRLPPKCIFQQRLSSTYHNTLVDLIFVRTVNIPNLSFLPTMHDTWYMMHDA